MGIAIGGPAHPLNEQEQKALELCGQGKGQREIASIMCVSFKTVDGWFQHIHQKLCTHNGTESVVEAVSRGILRIFCFLLFFLAVSPPQSQPDLRRFRVSSSVRVPRGGREA